MILSALFGVLLVAPVVIKAQTFCYDNQLPCVAGSSCVNNRCQCNQGSSGNGRTYCAANSCVCSSVADPHIFLFDGGAQVTANVPCSVFFSSYVSNDCSVRAYLDTEQRGTGNAANFRVFASQIRANVFQISTFFSTILTASASGATASNTNGVTTSNADGFAFAEFGACGTRIGYNETYGAAYLSIPTTGFSYTEFCGNCTNAAPVGTTPEAQLSYYLKHIAPLADQRGTYSATCGGMQSTLSTCSAANRDTAANVCLPYVTSFGQCLLNNGGFVNYAALLSNFATCISNVCSGNTAGACSTLTSLDTASAQCSLSPRPTACP